MEFTHLSDIHPKNKHATIQVLISRKWEFRGSSGNDSLQYVDMVLVDARVSIHMKMNINIKISKFIQ
jgi:maltooligosyltrehalose synthase